MKVNSQLISQFREYLESKSLETGVEYDVDSKSSIFTYLDEFKQFLKEEFSVDNKELYKNGFDVSDLSALEFTDGEFTLNKNTQTEEAGYFAEVLNNLMQEEEFSKSVDADNNGEISQDEYAVLLNALNTNNDDKITINELFKVLSGVQDGDIVLDDLLEKAKEKSKPDVNSSASPSGGGVSGSGPKSAASSELNLQNMSIEDLKAQLDSAKEEYTTAVSELENTMKQKGAELKSNLQDATQDVEQSQAQAQDFAQSAQQATSTISSNENTITSNEQQIAMLEQQNSSELNSGLEGQAGDLASQAEQSQKDQIEQLKDQNAKLTAENDKLAMQKQQDEAKEQEAMDEADLAEEWVAQYNEQINQMANSDSQVKAAKDKVDAAKAKVDEIQTIYDKRVKEQKQAENVEILDPSKTSKNLLNEEGFDNLPLSYTLDGKTYHCPKFASYDTNGDGVDDFSMDSWEEFQRYALNAGIANVGKYGTMQCQNASAWYMQFCLGTADMSIIEAMKQESQQGAQNTDTAGKMTTQIGSDAGKNQRSMIGVRSSDRDGSYNIIVNELKNGRPSVVSVPHANGSHYVLAMGISDDGDILIMDSYDCSMKKLGYANNSAYAKGDKQHRNMASGSAVMVFADGHTYQYSNNGDYLANDEYWNSLDGETDYQIWLALRHCPKKNSPAMQKRYADVINKYGRV